MAVFRADDDIYRARLVYMGPPGYTLPVQLPYAQWGLFALITAVYLLLGLGLTGGNWSIGGVALAASTATTYWIWNHVDPDRPARKLLATVATDWRHTKRPTGDTRLPSLSAGRIRLREQP